MIVSPSACAGSASRPQFESSDTTAAMAAFHGVASGASSNNIANNALDFGVVVKAFPQVAAAATHGDIGMPTLDACCQCGDFRALEPIVSKTIR